jgi:hypothetical protein
MSAGALHVEASKLLSSPKMALRVKELRGKLEKKALWTREMSVQALVQAYKVAKEGNSSSGMTGAVKELNAMHGYNEPTKIEMEAKVKTTHKLDHRKLTPEAREAILNALRP